MSTTQIDTIARAFADELELNPVQDTIRAAAVKATGLFAVAAGATALLATLIHAA